jgi:hypothetical protein
MFFHFLVQMEDVPGIILSITIKGVYEIAECCMETLPPVLLTAAVGTEVDGSVVIIPPCKPVKSWMSHPGIHRPP